jgi:hypothetical protein
MIRFAMVLLVFWLGAFCFLQGQSMRPVSGPKVAFMVAPLALFDPYSGASVRLGSEARISGRWSAYGEAGWFLPRFSVYEDSKGGSVRAEAKRYFSWEERGKRGQRRMNAYLGLGYFYKSQDFFTQDSIASGAVRYPIQKQVHAFSFKLGALHETKRLVLDSYVGLGLRYKNAVVGLTETEQEERQLFNEVQALYFSFSEARGFWPNCELGIRLGVRIGD